MSPAKKKPVKPAKAPKGVSYRLHRIEHILFPFIIIYDILYPLFSRLQGTFVSKGVRMGLSLIISAVVIYYIVYALRKYNLPTFGLEQQVGIE